MTYTMLAPNASATFAIETRAGHFYTSDAAGMIYSVPPGTDIEDILNAGGMFCANFESTQMGSATGVGALARESGNFYMANGLTQGNAANTTDDVLAIIPIPANAFDVAGRAVQLALSGSFAANADSKDIKIWAGPTAQAIGSALASTGMTKILDTGAITTNGGGWTANVQVAKYGAAGSNTQQAAYAASVAGSTHLGTTAPVALTVNEAAINYLVVTGSSASSAANDVVLNAVQAAFFN